MKAEHAKLASNLWWVAQSMLKKKFASGSVPVFFNSQLKPKYFKVEKGICCLFRSVI